MLSAALWKQSFGRGSHVPKALRARGPSSEKSFFCMTGSLPVIASLGEWNPARAAAGVDLDFRPGTDAATFGAMPDEAASEKNGQSAPLASVELLPVIYDELRRLARGHMARESGPQTLTRRRWCMRRGCGFRAMRRRSACGRIGGIFSARRRRRCGGFSLIVRGKNGRRNGAGARSACRWKRRRSRRTMTRCSRSTTR